MKPLNNSIVATRCFIFAEGKRHSGYNNVPTIDPIQLGWDPETRTVQVIGTWGCFRLFAYDKKFIEFETARMASRIHTAESNEYHDMKFRKHERPPVPEGWDSVTA